MKCIAVFLFLSTTLIFSSEPSAGYVQFRSHEKIIELLTGKRVHEAAEYKLLVNEKIEFDGKVYESLMNTERNLHDLVVNGLGAMVNGQYLPLIKVIENELTPAQLHQSVRTALREYQLFCGRHDRMIAKRLGWQRNIDVAQCEKEIIDAFLQNDVAVTQQQK